MTTNGTSPVTPAGETGADEAGEIKLGEILQALQRRSRLIVVVIVASVLWGGITTYWARKFHPSYQGGFKLLVSNPINDAGVLDGGNMASVALQRGTPANTATLIEVLTSPLVLEPLERSLKMPPGSLASSLTVSPGGNRGGTEGVLSVSLVWPNPREGERILTKLSQNYLEYSLSQRQEKLTQGLDFLDEQAPELQRRVNALQLKLAEIRQSNGFVKPEDQATAIISQRDALQGDLKKLRQEQARLEGRAATVRRGELTSGGGGSVSLPPALSAGFSAPSPGHSEEELALSTGGKRDDSLAGTAGREGGPQLDQLFGVEIALSEAEATVTADSP
ncbi:MAG: GumC family protein, partial [Cyanobacteriota bacterium]